MKKKVSFLIVMLCVVGLSLSACGRKGSPVSPEDKDPEYPRSYPAQQPVPELQ